MTSGDIWAMIDKEIEHESRTLADAGQLDMAIFQAFKYVEACIQERIGSKSIGGALLTEAFDGSPPKISISSDARDQSGVKHLFQGALGIIRSDRAHGKRPVLPCIDRYMLINYLGCASLLMYFLSRDRNIFPTIYTVEIFGSRSYPKVEIRGKNFGANAVVMGKNDTEFHVDVRAECMMQVLLPPGYRGDVKVVVGHDQSEPAYCDTHMLENTNTPSYEIVDTNIRLFEDKECTRPRSGVVGLLLKAIEGGREFSRIIPVEPDKYRVGFYVSHGPTTGVVVGESWFRESRSGEIRYAWTWSSKQTPNVICASGNLKLGGMSVLPAIVKCPQGEARGLKAFAWGLDGDVRKEEDVTSEVVWKSSDDQIAYVKDGVLYGKSLGQADITATLAGMTNTVNATVGHFVSGDQGVYLQGVTKLQKIRFDKKDNLYFANQTQSIFRFARNGAAGVKAVVRIEQPDSYAFGISIFDLDKHNNIYVGDSFNRRCLKYAVDAKGVYQSPEVVVSRDGGCPMGMAVDEDGILYVSMVSGNSWYIVVRTQDRVESSFEMRVPAVALGVDKKGRIYAASRHEASVYVYTKDGSLLGVFQYERPDVNGVFDAPSDIVIDDSGYFVMPFFYSGDVLRFDANRVNCKPEVIARNLGTLAGAAFDSKHRLYISTFTGTIKDSKILVFF